MGLKQTKILRKRKFVAFACLTLMDRFCASVQNYRIIMQRKRTLSKYQSSEIEDFISQLLRNDHKSNNLWVQSYLNHEQLQNYFTNIHKFITPRNFHSLKAFESLIDGLYILIKGQICFMYGQVSSEKVNMNKRKTSQSSITTGGVTINKTWSVFQCTYKNCTTTTESYLLRITEDQATLSRFFQLSAIRNNLYQNRYLSRDHYKLYQIQQLQKPFYVCMKIHSNFSLTKFNFRQIVMLKQPAIIMNGSAKLKVPLISSHQFGQYGVLLPNLRYEVLSSQICLMVVQNNQTLSYSFELQFDRVSHISQLRYLNSAFRTQLCTPKYAENFQAKKQTSRKKKQKTNFYKQSQHFSIISKFICQKNLNFAKNYNVVNQTKKKKQTRCKNPIILFDVSNKKFQTFTPNIEQISPIGSPNVKYSSNHKIACHVHSSHSNMLQKIKLSPAIYRQIVNKEQKPSLKNFNSRTKFIRSINLTLDRITQNKAQKDFVSFSPQNKQMI